LASKNDPRLSTNSKPVILKSSQVKLVRERGQRESQSRERKISDQKQKDRESEEFLLTPQRRQKKQKGDTIHTSGWTSGDNRTTVVSPKRLFAVEVLEDMNVDINFEALLDFRRSGR